MLSTVADYPICIDATRGIGDCCNIVDSNIVPAFYYMEAEQSVTAIFDAYRGMLQAEIDLHNEDVRESR